MIDQGAARPCARQGDRADAPDEEVVLRLALWLADVAAETTPAAHAAHESMTDQTAGHPAPIVRPTERLVR
jgi:hypothetical protein